MNQPSRTSMALKEEYDIKCTRRPGEGQHLPSLDQEDAGFQTPDLHDPMSNAYLNALTMVPVAGTCEGVKVIFVGCGQRGGSGTRPWWLALLACGGAYWPLAFEPSAMTSRHPYYCGHPHCCAGGGGVKDGGGGEGLDVEVINVGHGPGFQQTVKPCVCVCACVMPNHGLLISGLRDTHSNATRKGTMNHHQSNLSYHWRLMHRSPRCWAASPSAYLWAFGVAYLSR